MGSVSVGHGPAGRRAGRWQQWQQMYSKCTAVAANKRSPGAGKIPGKLADILVEIYVCIYMYSRIGEQRARAVDLPPGAGVPVFSALLYMNR